MHPQLPTSSAGEDLEPAAVVTEAGADTDLGRTVAVQRVDGEVAAVQRPLDRRADGHLAGGIGELLGVECGDGDVVVDVVEDGPRVLGDRRHDVEPVGLAVGDHDDEGSLAARQLGEAVGNA
jgi:hypothetical protein